MGSNPIGPMLTKTLFICMLRWCSPANHFGLSSRRLGFESRPEHFKKFVKIFNGFYVSFVFIAGVPERPKGTGLGPVDAGLPGFKSLLPHFNNFFHLFIIAAGVG